MDKKYLEALSNFAYALEELVEEMKRQSDAQAKATGGAGVLGSKKGMMDITNSLENIKMGIDEIKDSNQEILDNQKTILKMSKEKEKSGGLLSGLKENKKKVTEGVSAIVLMAGAILAIGLAFKVVGGVDFMAVIALSVAMPLIAIAFTEVATTVKDKKLSIKDMLFTSLALVLMAGALTVSSWIMSGIRPISVAQFLTAVGVGITLSIASIGISFIVKKLRRVKFTDLLKLPVALVAISTAIMLSSFILGQTQPIAPSLLLNIVLQGIAMGIVAAAMTIPLMMLKLSGLKMKDVVMGGLFIVVIAAAIMVSSHLLALGNYTNPVPIMWAIQTSIALFLFSIPVIALGILSMTGVGLAAIALGAVMTLIVAATIMVTSHILGVGNYENYPDIGWVLGTALAIGLFGVAMLALGAIAMTGVGFLAVALGGAMALMVAGTIVAVSQVLADGDYSYGGQMTSWALATTMLFMIFTPMMVALGAMGLVSSIIGFFGGPDPFELAKLMMVQIASTIADVSHVLADGNYQEGPTEDWARGVSLAIGAFAPVFSYLQRSGVYSALFGGEAMKPEEYSQTMRTIGYAIIDVANVFNEGRVDKWTNGPTKKWAEGVGLAIGAFAPVFEILNSGSILDAIFGTEGPSSEDMGEAIIVISRAIMGAANIFASDTGSYRGGPTKKWAEGVGLAISQFAEVYEWVFDGWDWTPEDIEQGNGVIFRIAKSILMMGKIFQGYALDENGQVMKGPKPRWKNFPESKWTKGVTEALHGFMELYEWVFDGVNWEAEDIEEANSVIFPIARSILKVADILEPLGG